MSFFANEAQKAVAFVALKELERICKAKSKGQEECDLTPACHYEVGGETVTITIPDGTSVSRSEGENGDGIEMNTATQNTFGLAAQFELYQMLARFNLEQRMMDELCSAIVEVVESVQSSGLSTETVLRQRDADNETNKYDEFEQWRERLINSLPKREQKTPRKIQRDNPKLKATIKIN